MTADSELEDRDIVHAIADDEGGVVPGGICLNEDWQIPVIWATATPCLCPDRRRP